MAPILILYGTKSGQTEKVAHAIAETLRGEGADVDVRNAAEKAGLPSPEVYAGVVVAAPLYGGRYPRPVRRWARAPAGALGARPGALVTVCLAAMSKLPESRRGLASIQERLFAATGWRPDVAKPVAGALLYTRYGWLKRRILLGIVRREGGDTDVTRDYEYTDWNDLRAFARSFYEQVYGPRARTAAG